jgi:two-component system sensor histidine kinase UhpB
MSIQRRLVLAITFVLALSLILASALTYWHVVAKVRTEMRAALAVGARTAAKALDAQGGRDPARGLREVVGVFDGDRHLAAMFSTPEGRVLARSTPQPPDAPAPAWFYAIAAGPDSVADIPLAPPFATVGALLLRADPHNEVAEAWSDLLLTMAIMAVFFSLVLGLVFSTMRVALRPLRDLRVALSRIGAGDYTTRMNPDIYRELEPLRVGFDAMAERLAAMRAQNQALHEQILDLQEEERAELARDLHDDVAPFLFAVGADAAMIRRYLSAGAIEAVGPRAEAIAESARHMQKHLKGVLRRLAPETLIDLGLAGAIDDLVAFWKQRCPAVTFTLEMTDDAIEPPLDAVCFRVVQESLSNAIRHGDPTVVSVRVEGRAAAIEIRVADNGSGLAEGRAPSGFGLSGMRERVKAVGGHLSIHAGPGGGGVIVEATLPIGVTTVENALMDAP